MAYETLGEPFRHTNQESIEITITERIWGAILELLVAITKIFNISDDEILDALVYESDELAHICNLFCNKMAG